MMIPMTTSTERIEELLDFMREVDLPTLRALDRKLHLLLEQKEGTQLETGQNTNAREEFCRRYPHIAIDPELFALVGIHPENPIEEDKILIREQITRSLTG